MKHYIFSILLGTSYALTANAAVHINEIMVRNSSAVINDELNFEGWAEIYNSGDEEVDLSNCFFSDTDDDHFILNTKKSGYDDPLSLSIIR